VIARCTAISLRLGHRTPPWRPFHSAYPRWAGTPSLGARCRCWQADELGHQSRRTLGDNGERGAWPNRRPQVGRSLAGMLFTVGHGTLEIEELTGLLVESRISLLVDVRSFPGSRRLPQFGREAMAGSVPATGVRYEWRPALGGRRKPQPGSANTAWRNLSFQAYADYMASRAFLDALEQLTLDATEDDVAVMCSESVWWRCHRRLIADAAVLLRHMEVSHLFHDGRVQAHPPTPEARVDPSGILVYDVGMTPRLPS